MFNTQRPPRPRLTGKIFLYGLADIFGLTCIAIGGTWFLTGKPAVLSDFPTSTAEALICAAGGVAVMIWAVGHIVQEMSKQAPVIQAEIEQHLEKNRAGGEDRKD